MNAATTIGYGFFAASLKRGSRCGKRAAAMTMDHGCVP